VNGFIVHAVRPHFRFQVLLKLLGDVRTDMDLVQSADRRGSFQKDDPGDQLLGMMHFLPCAILHGLVQPLVAPVGAHLRMDMDHVPVINEPPGTAELLFI
jgi:hypothetical protein